MPFIPVNSGYEILSAPSDGANPVAVTVNETEGDTKRFVNAFATKALIIDYSVEIEAAVAGAGTPEVVTFTPPDSDARQYHVIVINEG